MLPDRANMYSDDDASSGGDSTPGGDTEDSSSESQTALIPKSVFGSEPKPGDTITLKAVSVHGDEVMCEKAEGGEEQQEAPPEEEGGDQTPSAPGGLSSMLSD